MQEANLGISHAVCPEAWRDIGTGVRHTRRPRGIRNPSLFDPSQVMPPDDYSMLGYHSILD